MKKTNSNITNYTLYILHYILLIGCSQQIPPTGGKKDIIAPKLVSSLPFNKQTSYKGKTVELFFDEYVVADNLQQKLQITPDAGEYDVKLLPAGLKLTFKKEFEKDNTYSLAFGDAVKDFSEKNPVKNLKVVFSTGSKIDSAAVSGTIRDIQSSKPMLDALVGLYKKSDTLNPEKIKPTYFTRTDSAGLFSIENVRPATYQLIAIDDKNRSMTYNIKNERIGYSADSIVLKPSTQISGVRLDLYFVENQPLKTQNSVSRINYYTFNYSKGLEKIKVQFVNPADSMPYFQSNISEIQFFNTKNKKDTILVKTTVTDSSSAVLESVQKIKFKDSKGNIKDIAKDKEAFRATVTPSETEEIDPKAIQYKLVFNKPIEKYNLTQIKIYSDSTKAEPLTDANFTWQNQHSILTISRNFVAKQELKIQIPKGTFISVENDTLPASKVKIKIKEEENYGTIIGKVLGTEANVIVELMDNNFKVVKTSNKADFQFSFAKPSEYYLRVTEDLNKNGKWDGGDFKAKKQPEKIRFYPEMIKLRKNFVLEGLNIDLSTK
jgi:hypothetical protein